MIEIQFSGRGGQGVVVASQLLGLAFFKAGWHPQCYSVFGGERRGAPLVSFLRADRDKILLKCEIRQPGELVCLDESLIDPDRIGQVLVPGGRILINTRRPVDSFRGLTGYHVAAIDASAVSRQAGLAGFINTAVLGAYLGFTRHLELDCLLEAVSDMAPTRIEENIEAARRSFEAVTALEA